MLRVDVDVNANVGLGEDLGTGVRRAMKDAGDHGFLESQELVAHGATDNLAMSGAEPGWRGNTLLWGYGAPYADDVEEGQDPHWIEDIDALKKWARRVLGHEAAAYPVRNKIAEEGTDPQPYVEPGFQAMVEFLEDRGLVRYVEDERT